jgi:manganese-dependent inorganic pyrophosphatase
MYQEQEIELTKQIAGLLCAAILSDTLMFRSPTCTPADKDAALALAEIAEINVEEFAQKMFEAGSDFHSKTEEEILNQDFKIFHSGDISFGVSQVSAMGRGELNKVQERIEPEIPKMLLDKKVDMLFVMLTDILEESTQLVFDGKNAKSIVKDAFGDPDEHGILLEGVVSRKKQLIPALMSAISER